MGAVMGSKLLKAIAVQGNRKVEAFEKSEIVRLNREGIKLLDEILDVKGLNINGTGDVVPFQNSIGSLPTRNYREGQFDGFEAISGDTVTKTMLVSRETCFGCVVRCKRAVETEFEGNAVIRAYGGAEYETLATFGSYCGNQDLASIQYANQLCNAYGIDTISCGATIAFAVDCYEAGLISRDETGGMELKYGNEKAVIALLEKIAQREGIGDLLADGSARAAAKIGKGAQALLSTCKGQEIPAHAPQAKRSLGLIYAVNPFGADHQSSEHDPMYEDGGASLYFERLALIGLNSPQTPGSMEDEKVRFAYLTEVFYSALDTYSLCQFVWGPAWTLYGPAEMATMLKASTGWDVSVDEILKVGERRLNMLRIFNSREGFTRDDDRLPEKFFQPLAGSGPTAGMALDKGHLEHEKDVYYSLAGWDPITGNPTRQRLKELELEWLAA
jgi:aldehyde:ferredoxin oxidoreductase